MADARVTRGGGSSGLSSLRADAAPRTVSYLRFNVRGVAGTVLRAVLQVYAYEGSADGPAIYPAGNRWSESGLTWGRRPWSSRRALADAGVVRSHSWISYNVTRGVRHNGKYSFALATSSTDGTSLYSRESRYQPRLILTVRQRASTPVPRKPSSSNAQPSRSHPIRAAFFYPWFAEGWNQQGYDPFTRFHPSLGYYAETLYVISRQIRAMQYGHIQAGIASWWGVGSRTDRRFPMLLRAAGGTGFKWAIYYEPAGQGAQTVRRIRSDLSYIWRRYARNPNYLHVRGKPVVFVYNTGPNMSCGYANEWRVANAGRFYVVLKVFHNYRACASQPNSWHQYAPSSATDEQRGYSFTISPGFYKRSEAHPRLGRNLSRWRQDVRAMVASHEPWQLVTTFNEWGEGTAIESAREWKSWSGYGAYLDALHRLAP